MQPELSNYMILLKNNATDVAMPFDNKTKIMHQKLHMMITSQNKGMGHWGGKRGTYTHFSLCTLQCDYSSRVIRSPSVVSTPCQEKPTKSFTNPTNIRLHLDRYGSHIKGFYNTASEKNSNSRLIIYKPIWIELRRVIRLRGSTLLSQVTYNKSYHIFVKIEHQIPLTWGHGSTA